MSGDHRRPQRGGKGTVGADLQVRPRRSTRPARNVSSSERFPRRRFAPRLPDFDYSGCCSYHLVISTHRARPLLANRKTVNICLRRLDEAARQHKFTVIAYCFMPSHLHLLIAGEDDSRLLPFVKAFKQATAFELGTAGRRLWQRGFYDRILRRDEDIEGVVAYIWENPVKAGLVVEWERYPYSGPGAGGPEGPAPHATIPAASGGPEGPPLRPESPPTSPAPAPNAMPQALETTHGP